VADLVGTRNVPRLNAMLKSLAAEGLDGVTNSAREAGQVIGTELIDDMDRLDDRINETKTRLQTWGAEAVSFAMNFGEGLGIVAANVANYFDDIDTDTSALEKNLLKADVAVRSIEVSAMGTRATTEDLKKLEESKLKLKEAQLREEQKIVYYQDRIMELTLEATKYAEGTKERIALITKADEYRVKIIEQQNKKLEEQEKIVTEIHDELTKDTEKRYKDAYELMTTEQKIAEHTKQRAFYEKYIRDLKSSGQDASEWEAKSLRELAAIEELRLGKLAQERVVREKLTEEIVRQRVAAGEITAEEGIRLMNAIKILEATKKQNAELEKTLSLTFQIRGRRDEDLSERVLKEKEKTLQDDILQRQINQRMTGNYDPLLSFQQNMLASVEQELAKRERVRDLVPRVGETRAQQLMGVDAVEFERLLNFVGDKSNEKRAADALEKIERKLGGEWGESESIAREISQQLKQGIVLVTPQQS
jgi:hypothetical protein